VGLLLVVAFLLAVPIGALSQANASACDPGCQVLVGLANLRSETEQLIPPPFEHSFIVKIDAATASAQRSDYRAALNQINALDNELNAAVQSGQISEAPLLEYNLLIDLIAATLLAIL
jgi:hypothetical protein